MRWSTCIIWPIRSSAISRNDGSRRSSFPMNGASSRHRRRRAQGAYQLGDAPFFHVNSDTIWIDSIKPNLARLAGALDGARMDALLLLAPAASSIGGSRRRAFSMAADGEAARRTRGGAVVSTRSAYAQEQQNISLNDYLYQNTYDTNAKQSVSMFTYMLISRQAYTPQVQQVLCIGMGVGIVPMDFARGGAQVDVVEINPAVLPVAQQYLQLRTRQAQPHLCRRPPIREPLFEALRRHHPGRVSGGIPLPVSLDDARLLPPCGGSWLLRACWSSTPSPSSMETGTLSACRSTAR